MIYWCKKYTVDAAVYRCLTTCSRFVLNSVVPDKKMNALCSWNIVVKYVAVVTASHHDYPVFVCSVIIIFTSNTYLYFLNDPTATND